MGVDLIEANDSFDLCRNVIHESPTDVRRGKSSRDGSLIDVVSKSEFPSALLRFVTLERLPVNFDLSLLSCRVSLSSFANDTTQSSPGESFGGVISAAVFKSVCLLRLIDRNTDIKFFERFALLDGAVGAPVSLSLFRCSFETGSGDRLKLFSYDENKLGEHFCGALTTRAYDENILDATGVSI